MSMPNNKVYIPPGKGLIKRIGAIYIFLGVINILRALIVFLVVPQTQIIAFLFLISASWYIYIGSMGVIHCENLEKAKFLRNIAIIAIFIYAIIIILGLSVEGFSSSVLELIAELVFPILYLIGAIKNIEAYAKAPAAKRNPAAQPGRRPPAQIKNTNTSPPEANPFVNRAFTLLEEGDWDKADVLFEQALKENPENPYAYIGKLCIELRLNKEEDLLDCELPIADNINYRQALQFAKGEYRKKLEVYALTPSEREAGKEALYQKVLNNIEAVKVNKNLRELAEIRAELTELGDYKDAKQILETLGSVSFNTVISCQNCARKNASVRTTCLDCGAELN